MENRFEYTPSQALLHIVYHENGLGNWTARADNFETIVVHTKSLAAAKVLIEIVAQEELGSVKIIKETINYV